MLKAQENSGGVVLVSLDNVLILAELFCSRKLSEARPMSQGSNGPVFNQFCLDSGQV